MRNMLLLAALVVLGCGPGRPAFTDGVMLVSGGDSLYYRTYGHTGDTIIVLHGGPALSSAYLEDGLASLAETHTLLFYDQRGRGRSPVVHDTGSLTYTQDIADLEAVVARFGAQRVSLIGHHWGAGLAYGYARRHPERVNRLVLVSPMPISAHFVYVLASQPRDTAMQARWMSARDTHADSLDPIPFCREFWGFGFSPAEVTPSTLKRLGPFMCDAAPERIRERSRLQLTLQRSLGNWDWVDSLAQVSRPTLLVSGDATPALVANVSAWARHLPDARLLTVKGDALFPWVEHVNLMLEVEQFLGGHWPATALQLDSISVAATPSSSGIAGP